METAQVRMKKTRAKMLVRHPFFATLMMSMPMEFTDAIPTAATDMKKLYINPSFVDSITDDVLLFVLAHEIMHTALEHGLRRQHRPMMRWNIACDYSINLTLKDTGFKVWEQALNDEKYRTPEKFPMSADAIDRLLEKEQEQQKQQQGGQGGGQGQPDPNGQSQQGQGQGQQPQPPGMGQPGGTHHSPMLGDLKEHDGAGDKAAEDRLKQDIQQRVAQAAAIARMTGNMSGSLERFVKQILEPQVAWFDMLRHLMTECAEADEDWSHRDRRFQGIYLPTNRSERMGDIIMIGDTSGSISDQEMCKYAAEFRAIAEDLQPESVRVVWADSKVKGEQLFQFGEEVKPVPKGGGGTDMRVPLDHCEQYEPRVVVLFTDCATPWPKDPPPYPLIVCSTTTMSAPIGETVHI